MVYSLIGKKVLKAAVKKYGQTDLLKGTGKKLLKGAANIEKKADKIKQGKTYKNIFDRLPSQDSDFTKKPRVSFLKPLKITGGSGSTAYGDKGIKEIFPRPTLAKKNYSNLHPRLKNK